MACRSALGARPIRGCGLALLTLGVALGPLPVAARVYHAPRTVPGAAACTLPVTHDRYMGYHVGVPAGWAVSTLSGAIAVMKDPSQTEMAVLLPAILTRGLTPDGFFASYSRQLAQQAAAAHSTLLFQTISQPGQMPHATVSGREGAVSIRGRAEVVVLPLRTALASSVAVFRAYWAPVARLAADTALLAGIGACYGPERGTLDLLYQDDFFGLAIPQGWRIADESRDSIDVIGDAGRAVASWAQVLLPAGAGTSAGTLLRSAFAQMRIAITRILASTSQPGSRQPDGSVLTQEVDEFSGHYQGQSIHGVVYVLSDAGPAGTVGVLRFGFARASQWNADNSGIIHVVSTIHHNPGADQAQWDHLNRQWQQQDQTQQQIDNIVRGVQDVRDPSTGQVYEAPYSAYDPNGPDGPGYYIDDGGTLRKLEPVNG